MHSDFFAPVSMDMIDSLIAEHRAARQNLEFVSETLGQPQFSGVVRYYLEAAEADSHRHSLRHIERLFDAEKASKVLDSDYWNRALSLTDVLDCMPERRRQEWFDLMQKHETPPFEEQTVRATLIDLLSNRARFFAERVDGLFQALSREHVTNCPEGFGKRMILYYAYNSYALNRDGTGYINDLRAVIAKLTGREEPKWYLTSRLIDTLKRHTGRWFDVDGGALRIRLYKKGTAHLEVHADMAWRLNQVLAFLHPAAIPSEFRTPPKKRGKQVSVMQQPLPYCVTEILDSVRPVRGERFTYYFSMPVNAPAGARDQAIQVLKSLGGVMLDNGISMSFDYAVDEILAEIVISGCVPDSKSHQFYPTPEALARRVVELAEIDGDHSCLEPQAGQGGLAKFMPMERTTCVEISPLHCEILRSKGFSVVEGDFLTWQSGNAMFDRVVMNPPFNLGRWGDHLHAAAARVAPGGRLVAILPSGAKTRTHLPNWDCVWHGPFENEFTGTSVAVTVLVADKPVRE